mmetsp:Transcript_41878/g.129720  ORF Transcript_41878/g.129720 Transcript_41878/m.129720 type:complete len:444 (-) Transcript_41878:3-1334(-)
MTPMCGGKLSMRTCDFRNSSSWYCSLRDSFERIFMTYLYSGSGEPLRLHTTTFPPSPCSCSTSLQQKRSKIFSSSPRRAMAFGCCLACAFSALLGMDTVRPWPCLRGSPLRPLSPEGGRGAEGGSSVGAAGSKKAGLSTPDRLRPACARPSRSGAASALKVPAVRALMSVAVALARPPVLGLVRSEVSLGAAALEELAAYEGVGRQSEYVASRTPWRLVHTGPWLLGLRGSLGVSGSPWPACPEAKAEGVLQGLLGCCRDDRPPPLLLRCISVSTESKRFRANARPRLSVPGWGWCEAGEAASSPWAAGCRPSTAVEPARRVSLPFVRAAAWLLGILAMARAALRVVPWPGGLRSGAPNLPWCVMLRRAGVAGSSPAAWPAERRAPRLRTERALAVSSLASELMDPMCLIFGIAGRSGPPRWTSMRATLGRAARGGAPCAKMA